MSKKYLVSPNQSQLQTAMQMQSMQQQNAMQPNYYLPGQQNSPPQAVPPYQQVQQPPAHTAMLPPRPPNSQQQPPYNQQPTPSQAQTLPRPPPVYHQPPPPQAQTLPRPPPVYHQPPPPQMRPPHLMQQQTTQTVVIAPGATRVQVKQVSRQSSMNFTHNPTLPRRNQHQYSHADIKKKVYNMMPNTRKAWIKDAYVTTAREILQDMNTYKEGKVEKAVDFCCHTWWCGNSGVADQVSMSKNLKIARSKGGNVIRRTFSASYEMIKEILIYYQFLFALANLILSVICLFENKWSVSNGEGVYDIIGFALSAVAFVYTSLDAAKHFFTYTVRCKSCYMWRKACCSKHQESNVDGCGKDLSECCICKCCICKCCKENCETIADIVRLLITEFCFYFLLLLSIFQLLRDYVDGSIYETSGVDWALFGIGMAQDLGPVYICRFFVLAGSLYSIQKLRNAERKSKGKSGVVFYVFFVAQAYGQLLLQIMMIFTISATYYHQYNNCSNFNTSNTSNHITPNECYTPSVNLIYMVILGLVNPTAGTLMFLMVCRYWTQNLSIKMILDMTSKLIKTRGADDVMDLKNTTNDVSFEDLTTFRGVANDHYEQFSRISFFRKFQYPFGNPLRISLSLFYTGFLMGFIFSAIFALSGLRSPAPDWLYHFYIAEAIFALIVNGYVVTIAIVWALIIFAAILLCILAACTSSNRQRTQYR